MVYIAGDNDLDTFGTKDIEEMMAVCHTGDDLTILVQQDQSIKARDSGTKRFVIRHGKKEKILHLGETNTGDASTLTEFLRWGIDNYESDRNIAVLWNHGGGTKDEILEGYENAATVRSVHKNPTLGNQGSFFSESSRIEKIKTLMQSYEVSKGEPTRTLSDIESKSILYDDESKDFLDNLELKKVFDDLGVKLDIIGFDACLMSMLEVVYQLRDHAEIIVGSEELEPGNGWDYEALVNYLVNNPDASNEEVSSAMVEMFVDSYVNAAELKVTLSAICTEELSTLASDLNAFAYAILRNEARIRRNFLAIVDETQTFDYNIPVNNQTYRDLKHFVLLTQENYEENEEIFQSATKLLNTLDILMVHNLTNNFENAHGLSIYLPLMPTLSDFAMNVFTDLDINGEEHAPYWLKLFKQIGNLDRNPNQHFQEKTNNDLDDWFQVDEEIL